MRSIGIETVSRNRRICKPFHHAVDATFKDFIANPRVMDHQGKHENSELMQKILNDRRC